MSIDPKYTFSEEENSVPQWQKDLIDQRLAEYNSGTENTLDWEELSKELDKEDEAL